MAEPSTLSRVLMGLSGFGAGVGGQGPQFQASLFNQQQAKEAKLKALSNERKKAMAIDASLGLDLLNAGDLPGFNKLMTQRAQLLGQDPNADSSHTMEIMQRVNQGDVEGVKNDLGMLVKRAEMSGFLEPRGQEQQTFEPVYDDNNELVAQRNKVTGKIIADPRVKDPKEKAAKFTNFVGPDGGFVTFDTSTTEGRDLANKLLESGGRKASPTDATPTVEQGKAAGFTIRSENASDIIDDLGSQFTGALARGSVLPNFTKSADRQRFEQATRNLVNAVLRRESGAVISDAEFANAREQYIPQPGDSAEVVAQKAANRRDIIAGLRAAAGKGALKSVREQRAALEPAAVSESPQTTQGTNPAGVSDAIWNAMPPEDQALFK